VAALDRVPAARRTSLRYEDLLADPAAGLARLAGFIGIGAPGEWLDLACRTVDPTRNGPGCPPQPEKLSSAIGVVAPKGRYAPSGTSPGRSGPFGAVPLMS
jgi:hypothetical protein